MRVEYDQSAAYTRPIEGELAIVRSQSPPPGRPPTGSIRHRFGLWLAYAIALLLAGSALADVRHFRFQPANGDPGLAQHTVSALLQDRTGYIWVGTQGGLHRYDGRAFRVFQQASADTSSLPDNFVTALADGAPGKLWVGTNSAYVAELDETTGKFRRLLPADLDHPGEPGKRVLALYFEPGQGLWVASKGGIDLLDPDTGQRRSVLRAPSPAALRDPYGFARDDSGALWVTLPAGLYRIDPVTLATRRIQAPAAVADIVRDQRGRLWVSAADGLYRLDPVAATLQRASLAVDASEDVNHLMRMVVDTHDRLWISTVRNGLIRFDPDRGQSIELHANAAQEGNIPEELVNALLVDRSGLLWIGTMTDGLFTTDADGSRFTLVNMPATSRTQRYANSVRSLYQSPDGALWIGTDGDGLKRYDIGRETITDFMPAIRAALPPDQATSDILVYAIFPADEHALWLGTNAGLLRFDAVQGRARMQALAPPDAPPLAVPDRGVHAMAASADGGLWVGTQNQGLLRLDAHGQRVQTIGPGKGGLSSDSIIVLHADSRDRFVWIGTMDGLDRLDTRTGRIDTFLNDPRDPQSLSGNRIRAIARDRDGNLWIGTHTGLDRVVVAGDGRVSFRRFPLGTDPDHPGTVYGIAADAHGMVWVSSNDGVMRLDPRNRQWQRFTVADGLQNPEFNGGAYFALADGRIAFGGIRGLNLFDPARIELDRYSPAVVLTDATVGSRQPGDAALAAPASVRFDAGARVLRLRFAALAFADPARISYRYQLQGFDRHWVDAGHRPNATYTNLDAGNYVFIAQATNHDGIWSPHELRLPVTVLPEWWNTTAARIGYAVLIALALALAWYLVQRRHRREIAFGKAIERREQQLKMALWGSGDEYWDLDLGASTIDRSTATGDSPRHLSGPVSIEQWRSTILHPDDVAAVEDRFDRHLRGETDHFESRHRVRDPQTDQWHTVLARGKVVERAADGRPLRMAGTTRDITRQQHDERERAIAGEVLNSMAEAVCVIDTAYRFVSVNRAFALMTGYDEAEVIGLDSNILDSLQHPPEFYRDMRRTLDLSGRWSGEMWQRRKDDEEFLCAIEATEVIEPNGQRGHFVVVLNDITERKRAEQELRYLANFDTLTGLPNRALLSERLARAIVRARRHDTMVAVLFLDLDRFKEINDALGHSAGDRILKAVAAHLQATTNPSDTVSRLGGDEFTIVVEDVSCEEDAFEVARNILAAFVRPVIVDDRSEITITPSIGIAMYPAHGLAPTDLLKHADTAMYQAKAIGRNTYLAYTDQMEAQTRQRANITAALRRAVDRNEFQLLYQPRLSLARGRISGCEALLRWHSEELGEMMPGDFIPIAEETGLIVRIGEWALREACRTLALWQREGLSDVRIAVNVSVLQLLRGDLPQLIASILAESGAPPACLELELTETMVMSNAAETRGIFDKLRDMGLSLAVDDFGTGYSSLVYLKQLPIDMLKIDKQFIADITRDPDDEAITTTIITMAHSLGLTVIAEGVEVSEQLDFLREHACDEIQGFWLSQPLSEPHCRTFIQSWHHITPRPAADPATLSTQ